MLPASSAPDEDPRALGVARERETWGGAIGAQVKNNPMNNTQVQAVLTPAAHRKLAWFYLTNPLRIFHIVESDLGEPAERAVKIPRRGVSCAETGSGGKFP